MLQINRSIEGLVSSTHGPLAFVINAFASSPAAKTIHVGRALRITTKLISARRSKRAPRSQLGAMKKANPDRRMHRCVSAKLKTFEFAVIAPAFDVLEVRLRPRRVADEE